MEPLVVFEDEHVSVLFGYNPVTLGHLRIYPKANVKTLEELPSKVVAHLFTIATRCASLLFDGMQAQGSNIIVNEGKNANQAGEKFCIDVIARSEGDGLKFNWDFKQGNYEQVKKVAAEIASKVVVYEKPPEPAASPSGPAATSVVSAEPKKELVADTPKEDKAPVHQKPMPTPHAVEKKAEKPEIQDEPEPPGTEEDKKNFLYYELMRMP